MKKTILISVLLVIALITLSGCTKVEYSTTINKDGSGEISYICTMNKTVIESLGKNNASATYDLRTKAESNGYSVEDYETEELAGFKATKKVQNVSDKSYINELFENYVKNGEESKINIKSIPFGKKYLQKAVIDSKELEQLKELGAVISYSITLPTKVGKTNADFISKDKKTITWNLDLGTTEEIYFVAKTRTNIFLDIFNNFSYCYCNSRIYYF